MNRSKPKLTTPDSGPAETRPRGQFGIASMMLWMVMISVAASVFGGLIAGGVRQQTSVLLGLVAPIAVLVIFGAIDQFRRWRRASRRHDDW